MTQNNNSLERANKRVKELKGFYRHITVFLVVNGFLYLMKSGMLTPFMPAGFPTEHYYYDWINANVLVWAFILVIHAAYTFRNKFTFFKKWEERQIQKYMEEDRENAEKYK